MVAKPSGNKNKHVLLYPDSCFNDHLVAIPSGQPLALAAALGLATSTPLTEAGRKTQRALYIYYYWSIHYWYYTRVYNDDVLDR